MPGHSSADRRTTMVRITFYLSFVAGLVAFGLATPSERIMVQIKQDIVEMASQTAKLKSDLKAFHGAKVQLLVSSVKAPPALCVTISGMQPHTGNAVHGK